MLALLALLQATAQPAPDIELNIHARAKSVEIRRKGEAKLEVTGAEGSRVEARVEPKAEGRSRLRNVTIDVHAEASVKEGAQIDAKAETDPPS
jgi:hypothetical protein